MKNAVVYEIISSLPLPAENATLDSGADDLASMAAATAKVKTPKRTQTSGIRTRLLIDMSRWFYS